MRDAAARSAAWRRWKPQFVILPLVHPLTVLPLQRVQNQTLFKSRLLVQLRCRLRRHNRRRVASGSRAPSAVIPRVLVVPLCGRGDSDLPDAGVDHDAKHEAGEEVSSPLLPVTREHF